MLRLEFGVNQFDGHDEEALKYCLSKIKSQSDLNLLEVGCWTGKSTSFICEYAKKRRSSVVFCVDTFKGSEETVLKSFAKDCDIQSIFEANMKELGNEHIIQVYPMESAKASQMFPNKYFDFIFIDADHRYGPFKDDLLNWFPKLKMDGILCGHDFDSFEYDERYVDDDYVNGNHHGIAKALTECFNLGEIETRHRVWLTRKKYETIQNVQ